MPTRRQNPEDAKFRQDAFSSSTEHDRGSLGNLVADRCHKFTDPEEIAMYWWLQQVSWRDGGLKKFATDFLAANQSRIGTPSMLSFGMVLGHIYNPAQVRQIRAELPDCDSDTCFPLKGENPASRYDYLMVDMLTDRANQNHARRDAISASYPADYPCEAFQERCAIFADDFAEMLKRSLVDPASEPLRKGRWNFPALWERLAEWRRAEVEAAKAGIVETEITRTIFEELDFALHSRSFILIEGLEGIGKSEGAKAWCRQRPGQAVYVSLDSSGDEASLYRSIARAIGTACSYGYKTAQMRARVQDALQAGYLMLVIDEAHFLWPQSERSHRSAPMRIEWLRTALVDFGVPVALISTPQYFQNSCAKFIKSGWNANQVQRRITHTIVLPDEINATEMKAVATRYFPNASDSDLDRIVVISCSKFGFLTIMMHLRKRVDFLAAKQPGRREADCLDEALAAYDTVPKQPEEQELPPVKAAARRLQKHGKPLAAPIPGRSTVPENLSRIHSEEPQLTAG